MRRKVGLFCVCGLLLPLLVAANAFSQGSILQVNVKEPRPGQAITVNGTSFIAAAGYSPVHIRLSTRSGRILATAAPDSLGRIAVTFPVPANLRPGWYLILATQSTTANNRARAFVPGRTRIRVRPGAAAAASGGRGGLPNSPLGIVALGSAVVLLAAGGTLTARKLRTLNRPRAVS